MNSNDGMAATMYSLGTRFVSGICQYIPCIKETMMMMMIIIIIITTTTIIIIIIIIIIIFLYVLKRLFF
jgi:hypothetical protein